MTSGLCQAFRRRAPALTAAIVGLAACADPGAARAQGETFEARGLSYRVVTVAGGLENPWGIDFLPDGSAIVTERPGRMRVLRDGRLSAPLTGVPEVYAEDQGGLLDVKLHPNFARNRLVYFTYAFQNDDGTGTRVARGRLTGNGLANVETVFEGKPLGERGNGKHFGSRLAFGQGGMLYVTTGERSDASVREQAQDLASDYGKVHRMRDDGTAPRDNPFIGRAGARPTIFTYGNRNPQGLDVQPSTGVVWEAEFGPSNGDEVNVLRPGANYGWPYVSYGDEYSGDDIPDRRPNFAPQEPAKYWVPSISPSGMDFYDGNAFSAWRGDLFVSSLGQGIVSRLDVEGGRVVGEEQLLGGEYGRIRDVATGPDGFLYLLTDNGDDQVLRLEPAAGTG